mgnify:FL=1
MRTKDRYTFDTETKNMTKKTDQKKRKNAWGIKASESNFKEDRKGNIKQENT